jgi:hypothetical protein
MNSVIAMVMLVVLILGIIYDLAIIVLYGHSELSKLRGMYERIRRIRSG